MRWPRWMGDMLFADRVWYGSGPGPAVVRALLAPLGWTFGIVARARNLMYDAGMLPSTAPEIPVVSIGNLAVGGTGKTPLAAYVALRLRDMGAQPALVMRGVGDDESRSYALLAPGIPVVVDADRVRAVNTAARRGCTVAVLDDAFQHRRIRRQLDIVVLSADRDATQLLPAGPLREPFKSVRRAGLVVVTRKAANHGAVARIRDRVRSKVPRMPIAEVALWPAELIGWRSGEHRSLASLDNVRAIAIAGIGDPGAFLQQIALYVGSIEPFLYRDHYAYTARDIALLAERAGGFDVVVCTLKDAVKLGPRWPRQAPELWYVSQRLEVEQGESEIERMLARLLDLRHAHRP